MSSPDSSPTPLSRRKRSKLCRSAEAQAEGAQDDERPFVGRSLGAADLAADATSMLPSPPEDVLHVRGVHVPPCDPLALLSASVSSLSREQSTSDSQHAYASGSLRAAHPRQDVPVDGVVLDVADLAGPSINPSPLDVTDVTSQLSPNVTDVVATSVAVLDVPTILHQIKPNTRIVSSDGGSDMEWHHFLEPVISSRSQEIQCEEQQEDFVEVDTSCEEEEPRVKPSSSVHQLFKGSPLSVEDSVVAILTYALTQHLNGQSFSKLLDLITLLLPQPNYLPKSLSKFYQYFNAQGEVQMYYFCNLCWKGRTSSKDLCPDCTDPKRSVKFFLTSPIVPQISKMFARPGFLQKLSHKYSRQKFCDGNIEDVYDGKVYKQAEETFLITDDPNMINLSLSWYSDGISIYESSPYSLWPFMFIINELPPEERYKPENLVLAGLWGLDEKPHPNVFLLPIYHELEKLRHGFSVQVPGRQEQHVVKAFLLQGTCDTPARSTFMLLKGHSGYCSCPKCLTVGEKSAATGNVLVFPHENPLNLRTTECYNFSVAEALRNKDNHLGIIGPTILSYMTVSDFMSSISIDSMHCVDLGVTKQLLKLCFNSSHSSEPFSMSQKIDVINGRLLSLRLPHFVQRSPIGVDKLPFWKATLFRNFLLYMALPVMKGVMPDNQFENLSFLVNGISLLHQQSISVADLAEADRLLCEFSETFQRIYGKRNMSSNIHLLRHLAQVVEETGNLWVTSCYRFEDINGKLSNLAHGTTHASLQIYNHFFALSELELLILKLESMSLKSFCEKLFNYKKSLTFNDKVSQGTYVIGSYGHDHRYDKHITDQMLLIMEAPITYQTFTRLYRNHQLYSSISYSRGSRVSYHCKYIVNNVVHHGMILVFVKCCLKYYALISRSENASSPFPRYLLIVNNVNECIDLVPVDNLECVSFCLNIRDEKYVVDPLNNFDME